MFSRNKYLLVFMAILAVAGVFYGGFFFGQNQKPPNGKEFNIINQEAGQQAEVDFAPFWTAWNTVLAKYVSAGDLDGQKMVWGAVEGMVKSLGDPYSVFFPPQEKQGIQRCHKGRLWRSGDGNRDKGRNGDCNFSA